MAARKGLEPLTFGLGNRCSILLSYRAGWAQRCHAAGAGAKPRTERKTPGAGRASFASLRDAARVQAAAAFTSSDLFSMVMAASRSIRSMAATSRAMRSRADS